MNWTGQEFAALSIVGLAVAYLVSRLCGSRAGQPGCGGCASCLVNQPKEPDLVSLGPREDQANKSEN